MPSAAIETATGSTVTESVTIIPVSERTARLCQSGPASWSTDDLAWYLREEIARLHGPQLPCPGEDVIVRQFHERFGADAVRIARAAFEHRAGMWMGAPVTMARFRASHDEFFSRPLLAAAE